MTSDTRQSSARQPVTALAEWRALAAHAASLAPLHLREMFRADPGRGTRLVAEGAGLYVDYSKNRITDETLALLLALADRCGVANRAAAMFRGDVVNVTENRAALHVALRAAPDAVILVVTDPPDPLADVARACATHDRVLSAGTFLDSLRFRVHLARHFDVDAGSVEAQVIGDHGTSQVFLWSGARVAGVPVRELIEARGQNLADVRAGLEKDVRYANITIIEGNNASQFGIGIVSARIAEMVVRDERAVIPIGSFNREFGVTLSLPSVVGRNGVSQVLAPEMSAEERQGLEKSAESLRSALQRVQQKAA